MLVLLRRKDGAVTVALRTPHGVISCGIRVVVRRRVTTSHRRVFIVNVVAVRETVVPVMEILDKVRWLGWTGLGLLLWQNGGLEGWLVGGWLERGIILERRLLSRWATIIVTIAAIRTASRSVRWRRRRHWRWKRCRIWWR